MLLDPFSRFFIKYDLAFRPWYGRGAPLSLVKDTDEMDALTVIQKLFNKGDAFLTIKAGDVVKISVLDYRPNDKILVILFRHRNAHASTQVFEHEETGEVRAADRKVKEHPAVSAHLIIDLRDRNKAHPSYKAVLEEVPGLSQSYVKTLLGRAVASYKYEGMNDKGIAQDTHTVVDFDGLPSQTLGDAIGKGGLDFIELVRQAKTDGLDNKGLVSSPERLKLSVKKADGIAPMDVIRRVQAWAKDAGWEDLRVQVRNEHDRSKVVQVDREADAATVLFVQGEQVLVTSALPDCAETVNEELITKARKLFDADKKWV